MSDSCHWRSLIEQGFVVDAAGGEIALHSNTSLTQCLYINSIVRFLDARRCLEVGLAYGISSLAICETMKEAGGGRLISIDPFQQAHWKNIGLLNLERAGFRNQTDFHPAFAEEVLPQLAAAGTRLDFAYVDGSKVFDAVLIQAHYIIQMLRVGGLLVFDDCGFPGLSRAVRWLNSLPHLKLHSTFGPVRRSFLRNATGSILRCIPYGRKIFRGDLIAGPVEVTLASQCVCFMKIAGDERRYDWDFPL